MKPALGVCYYPEHWPETQWADDARRMRELGLSWVRIGEFAWSRIEPKEGTFDWGWLDRAVEVLANEGLKLVMGTPTATPPIWVVEKFPDMLPVDADGNIRKFGSRRHYDFSHLGYRAEAARISRDMAARYGDHRAVLSWQIDNEYGCHDTTLSYSKAARVGFRDWLAQKYQSPDVLNRAWGNVFWSMEYRDFDDIDLPNQTVTEPNPSHLLDFRRYSSDQVIAFNQAQIDAMRPHTERDLIHNYMGRILDFDHFALGEPLDIASWDSYPLGFLEDRSDDGEDWKARFSQAGAPDFQAFHHDLYRGVGKGRWWVMEQQPGPVNWAPWNPAPRDGMVRLWTWEAIAHGAEVVSYFRWRQAPFAQEQMHSGLLRTDGEAAPACREVAVVSRELADLADIATPQSDVAIVFDYASAWAWETQPQGRDFDYFRLVFENYRALRALGFSVDILPASAPDFGDRKLVIIPGLFARNSALDNAIRNFGGQVVIGPRAFSKTPDMTIPNPLPPAVDGLDVRVSRVSSLRPNVRYPLQGGGNVLRWFETLEGDADVTLATEDACPVVMSSNNIAYLGAWLDLTGLGALFAKHARMAGLTPVEMPNVLRRRATSIGNIYFNYDNVDVVWRGNTIPPSGVYFERLAGSD